MKIKNLVFFLFAIASLNGFAQRHGTMEIRGTQCDFDTLIHRTIGPGATYTRFQFDKIKLGNINSKMRAHVIKIDMDNQYNNFKPYLANDQYCSGSKQHQEVNRHKGLGLKPIASMNGSAFNQSYKEGDTSDLNELVGSIVANRVVNYEVSGRTYNWWKDGQNSVHVDYSQFDGSVKTSQGTLPIGQVNHYRDIADKNNQVALFCNGINKTKSVDNSTGVDVIIRKKDGTSMTVGKNVCVVENIQSGCEHSLSAGNAALSAGGEMAQKLSKLAIGEEIEVNLDYVDADGNPIDMVSQITNFKTNCIREGKVLNDDTKNYAIAAIGISKDNKTCYWVDIEISDYSNAPVICLSDLMANIGVWNAMWLDGGPSAEMTIDGDYVTINSIGHGFQGRLIPGGLMMYSTAPDDNTLTRVELPTLSSLTIVEGQSVELPLYGYNKYDEMIDAQANNNGQVEIKCTDGIGRIENGKFFALKEGTGYIDIRVKGQDGGLVIPVKVKSSQCLSVYPKKFFTGEGRYCQATLTVDDHGTIYDVDPADATWTASNRYAVMSCADGLIIPYIDGYSEIYVEYQGMRDTMYVEVENLQTDDSYVDVTPQNPQGHDFDIQLPSVPRWFSAQFQTLTSADVTLTYKAGSKNLTKTKKIDGVDTMMVILDYYDVEGYPVVVRDFQGESALLTKLISGYNYLTAIKEVKYSDACPLKVERSGSDVRLAYSGERTDNVSVTVSTLGGRIIYSSTSQMSPNSVTTIPDLPNGVLLVRIKTSDTIVSRKVM